MEDRRDAKWDKFAYRPVTDFDLHVEQFDNRGGIILSLYKLRKIVISQVNPTRQHKTSNIYTHVYVFRMLNGHILYVQVNQYFWHSTVGY